MLDTSDRTFSEYSYIGTSGAIYYPAFRNGHWRLINDAPRLFNEIMALCDIPYEEATMLKLVYGS